MKKTKTQKGITLVALIITIVVLLILAVVSIGAVRDSKIINHAQNAAVDYETGKRGENEQIAGYEALLDKYASKEVSVEEKFKEFMENPETFAHSEQSPTNNDRAIGTDGTPVNMDSWHYIIINDTTKEVSLTYGELGCAEGPSYKGNFTAEGSIIGSVPQYIKIAGKNEIYTVTSMEDTFYDCKELITAPVIPSTVTSLRGTFNGCDNLTGIILINSSNISDSSIKDTWRYILMKESITIKVPANSETLATFETALAGCILYIATLETF